MSAVVVGCLSPDFEYFLRLAARGSFGHTIGGLFWFDLPLSLIVLVLWHRYGVRALTTLSPRLFPVGYAYIDAKPLGSNTKEFAIVSGSVLVGALTHIIWDSFTHPVFWPYRHFHLLREALHFGPVGMIPIYKVLQHGSTIVGMSILVISWVHWVRSKASRDVPVITPFGYLITFAALIIAGARLLISIAFAHHFDGPGILASDFVVTFIAVMWIELVLYGSLRTQPDVRSRGVLVETGRNSR